MDDALTGADLAAHAAFGRLPDKARDELARKFRRRLYGAGNVMVREGEVGDKYCLIASGIAEVWGGGESGETLLACLGPGDDFGEIALISPHGRRRATVRALVELVVDELSATAFRELLVNNPALESHFGDVASRHVLLHFLKLATPFSHLDIGRIRALADKLRRLNVTAGTEIIRQGDDGDACYFLQEGKAEVILTTADGSRRTLAELGPGALVGEVALLSDAPRNATVQALEPCALLALQREDLLAATGESVELAGSILELAQLRARPRQAPLVRAHHRQTPEADTVTVLVDERRHAYYRLSPEGWFVWQRLSGDATFKDLVLAHVSEYKRFAPDRILAIVDGLGRAGFLEGSVRWSPTHRAAPETTIDRVLHRVRRLLEWRVTLRNVDGVFAALYRSGGFLFFTRPASAVLAVVIVLGMVAAALSFDEVLATFHQTTLFVLFWLIPANIVAIVLHECGHALATKDAGRVVRGAGVGWYWFQPIAFIDTTDMWLADRRDRIRGSLAGPYVNLVIASVAAITSWLTSGLTALVALQVAAVNYVGVVLNLNPLLEYDGYDVLADWLDRPNLRRDAWRWLGSSLPAALRRPRRLLRQPVLLAYGLGSLLYVFAMVVATVWVFRALFEERLTLIVSRGVAVAVAWIVALLIALSATAGVWSDMRTARPTAGTGRRSSP